MIGLKVIVLAIAAISVEIQCQRHIIGSRMLNFDNPMGFASFPGQLEREGKELKVENTNSGTSDIEAVMDSRELTFDDSVADDTSSANNKDELEECVPLDKCESLDWLVQNINTVPNLSSSQIIETIKDRICGFYGRIPKVRCPSDDDNYIEDSNEYDDEYDYDEYSDDDINETTNVVLEPKPSNDGLSIGRNNNGGFVFGGSHDSIKNKTQNNNSETSDSNVSNALNGVNLNSEHATTEDTNIVGQSRFLIGVNIPQTQKCKGSLLIHHSASNGSPLEDFKQLRLKGKSFRQMRKLRRRNIVQMQTHGNCCWKIYSMPNFRGIEEQFYNGYNIVPKVHPKSIKATSC